MRSSKVIQREWSMGTRVSGLNGGAALDASNEGRHANEDAVRGGNATRTDAAILVAGQGRPHFHLPECPWAHFVLPTTKAVYYSSRDEAIASGKHPCKT